jgi:hypothetical protein
MIPLILGLGSAALFLGLSIWVYGAHFLFDSTWVALVFAGLITSGLAVYAINRPIPAGLRRLLEGVKAKRVGWHAGAPCR